jgi:hypothetical protein
MANLKCLCTGREKQQLLSCGLTCLCLRCAWHEGNRVFPLIGMLAPAPATGACCLLHDGHGTCQLLQPFTLCSCLFWHRVGPDAPEIMQGIAIALKCGATKKQFDSTVSPVRQAASNTSTACIEYPTQPLSAGRLCCTAVLQHQHVAGIDIASPCGATHGMQLCMTWRLRTAVMDAPCIQSSALRLLSTRHGPASAVLCLCWVLSL